MHGEISIIMQKMSSSFQRLSENHFLLLCRVIIHFKHLKHELHIKQTKEDDTTTKQITPTTTSSTAYKTGQKRPSCSTAPAKKFKCNSLWVSLILRKSCVLFDVSRNNEVCKKTQVEIETFSSWNHRQKYSCTSILVGLYFFYQDVIILMNPT